MIVVDNSVYLAWCVGEESDLVATETVLRIANEGGVAPHIWWYELRNALLMNERRGRISSEQTSRILAASLALNVEIDENHDEIQLLDLARRFDLTAYDAAYLEVAFRRGLPLATFDRRLRKAAEAVGVAAAHHEV